MTSSNGNNFIVTGHSPVTGEFPPQRPVTWSFDVFFDLRLNEQLSKQWRGWWFETPSCPLWCHCNDIFMFLRHNSASKQLRLFHLNLKLTQDHKSIPCMMLVSTLHSYWYQCYQLIPDKDVNIVYYLKLPWTIYHVYYDSLISDNQPHIGSIIWNLKSFIHKTKSKLLSN